MLNAIVRSVSHVLHFFARVGRLCYYNATIFCFFKPLPISTVIYGKIRVLHRPCRLRLGYNCRIGDGVYFATSLKSEIAVGDDVTINLGCVMVAVERIEIGRGTAIAEYVTIRDQEHRFTAGFGVRDQGYNVKPVQIGRNVWIGRGAYLGPGTVVGDNSIIGANSVVRGAYPSGVLIAGSPARIKKRLFPEV